MRPVTLDTNIYVSALEFGGKPMQLLQMGLDGALDIAVSQALLDEILRVLRVKLRWSDADLRDAEITIGAATYRVTPSEAIDVRRGRPHGQQNPECAVAAGADVIARGGSHTCSPSAASGTSRS